MFKFPKIFGSQGGSTATIDESAPFEEDLLEPEVESIIPTGEELSNQIDNLIQEVQVESAPYNAANVFFVDKSGKKIPIDEHRENIARADQQKIKEVRKAIAPAELPDLVSAEDNGLNDLRKKIALADQGDVMIEKRRIKEEQAVLVENNLANLAIKEAAQTAKKLELEAEEAKRQAVADEQARNIKSRWLDPDKVLTHPRGYKPKIVDEDKMIAEFHEALEKGPEENNEPEKTKLKVVDKRANKVDFANLEGSKNTKPEVKEKPEIKIVDKRSSPELSSGLDGVKNIKPSSFKVEDKRAVKISANESLLVTKKEIDDALNKKELPANPVNKEIEAIDNSLGEETFSLEAAKRILEANPLPVTPEAEVEKKNSSFWQKSKNFLNNHKVATQLLKTGIGSAASVLGYKSFYDVPAYFSQRYAVRGNVFGIGAGKGLEGSVEELISASQTRKSEINQKKDDNKGLVMDSLRDLDSRLSKTKEGSKKGSEQRQRLAKLLWENRHKEKQSADERKVELDNILDNYTTTKVTGIQAARETINTALVGTGAFALRGVAYGGAAYFEKLSEMRREARAKMTEADPSLGKEYIKNKTEEEVGIKQVFARGLKETFAGIMFKGGKTRTQKSLAAIKAFGSISRFAGIALGMSVGSQAYGASLDKVIDVFQGKASFSDVGQNFEANAHRLIPSFGSVEAAPLNNEINHSPIIANEGIQSSETDDETVEKLKEVFKDADNKPSAKAIETSAVNNEPVIEKVSFTKPAVAEVLPANNEAAVLTNLDKVLKADNPGAVVPMNKIPSVLPTEEYTTTLGSPEHIQAFLTDPDGLNRLKKLSEQAKNFLSSENSPEVKNRIMLSLAPLKNSLEDEFGGKLTFNEDGRISLNAPDGSSQELLSGASVQEDIKTALGDRLKFNTDEDLIKAAEKIPETVEAEVAQGSISSAETVSNKAPEDLDFAEAFEDEKTEDTAELEKILDKTGEKPAASSVAEVAQEQVASNESAVVENIPAPIQQTPEVAVPPEAFKALDANPMAKFPQEKLVFADSFSDFKKANLEEYFKSSLAERDEVIKQLADWKVRYGNRPQYATFEAQAIKWLNEENDHLERVVKAAAGEGEIESFSLGKIDPAEVVDMKMGFWDQMSKLRTMEERADDAFSDLDKSLTRNTFKPLENAVTGSGQKNVIASTETGNLESSEVVSTMTLAEAKVFDRPLNSVELAKNLAQQGNYINLRNVPSISSEVLKTFYNQGNINGRTFNFLGLKPELLNRETANLIKSFGNQVILSDEALRKVEDLTT